MYQTLFTSSSIEGLLDCFQFWGIMNNAAINIYWYVLAWTYILIVWEWQSIIVRSCGNMFVVVRNFLTVFKSGWTILCYHKWMRVPIGLYFHWHLVLSIIIFLNFSQSNMCTVEYVCLYNWICHCCFNFQCTNDKLCQTSFHILCCIFMSSLVRYVFKSVVLYLIGIFFWLVSI